MITLQEARKRINESVERLPAITVSLARAAGCLLAEEITAPIDVPGFPCSSMDGFAIRNADLDGGGPWRMPIQKVIPAGDTQPGSLLPNHSIKIMTGAPLLEGADTVIPVEEVDFDSGHVVIGRRPPKGNFVRPPGDDLVVGEKLFGEEHVLSPIDIGVLASIGLTEVRVVPRPTIALISTGSEVVEPGKGLQWGQIYDTNDSLLHAMLTDDHQKISIRRRVPSDDVRMLSDAIGECLESCDLVISTGGVSVGDFDLVPQAITALAGSVLFHGVAVKPGKPVLVANIGGSWFIGMPGNPVSTVVGYHLYVRQIVSRLAGVRYTPRTSKASLADDLSISGDRYCYIGARLEESRDGLIAHSATRQKSGRLSSLIGINGYITAEGGTRTIRKGADVRVEWI